MPGHRGPSGVAECTENATSALVADDASLGSTSVAERIDSRNAQVAVLRKRRQSRAVRAEMASAESELNALLNTPVSGGRDPFDWLPDELVLMIMLMLPFAVLWSGVCDRVCLRWARLMESTPVQRRKRDGRWAAYEAGVIEPRELEGHNKNVCALAVGLDGKVYSGSEDMTILVWSGTDGTHLQTLVGHTGWVLALAMGLDGKVYSGSIDATIRVWSGVDGTHIQTLVGHTSYVSALAVGLDGKVYSGSGDKTIRVWSGDDDAHVQTLVGHTECVYALTVGLDGKKVYSGSWDGTIRVWSGDDGTHLQTLVGHTHFVLALAVGLDGKVYSGSGDGTIRVWSGVDGTHLQTLVGHTHLIRALAVGLDGKVYCGAYTGICVWSCSDGALLHWLREPQSLNVCSVVFGLDGSLLTGREGAAKNLLMW
jgi:WD40 repeat protein